LIEIVAKDYFSLFESFARCHEKPYFAGSKAFSYAVRMLPEAWRL
jgi:hypothetical protein